MSLSFDKKKACNHLVRLVSSGTAIQRERQRYKIIQQRFGLSVKEDAVEVRIEEVVASFRLDQSISG